MMMRLQKYNISVHYECGAKMYIADLLSRAYLPEVGREDDKEFELVNMVKALPISDRKIQEIRQETDTDQTLQVVKSLILKGWPDDKGDLPLQATPYYSLRDELTVQDGLIFKGERLVVSIVPDFNANVGEFVAIMSKQDSQEIEILVGSFMRSSKP